MQKVLYSDVKIKQFIMLSIYMDQEKKKAQHTNQGPNHIPKFLFPYYHILMNKARFQKNHYTILDALKRWSAISVHVEIPIWSIS